MAAKKRLNELPPSNDWRTTDEQELERRQLRAKEERFQIVNSTPKHPVFSTFQVASGSGRTYSVEIRGLGLGEASCGCVDFSSNGLGTCKHVEAVRQKLGRRERAAMAEARRRGSNRWEVIPERERGTLRLLVSSGRSVPESLCEWFDAEGFLIGNGLKAAVEELEALTKRLATLRISQDVGPWVRSQLRAEERTRLRRDYEVNVQSGVWPPQETRVPLFPYQREGMLHLAFTERALLADEMGLGKTIQAIAACALLARLGQVRRVLVVTPASLKVEWEEQIQRFTNLSVELAYGGFHQRMKWLREGAATDGFRFFTVVNYEQVVPAVDEFNELHSPDVVILDEAQRIKNWNTRIAKTIKRLKSRYAFVLTGTPIENRIDELRSLVDFLDPSVLGPLFRFNREFYDFDERGRPAGYRNLHVLHQRVRPILLRRRKADVETELPARTDRNLYVKMTPKQRRAYGTHEQEVVRLVQIAERRLLTQREQDFLQIQLAMMRMICDTNYILDSKDRECPKLAELSRILEDCIANDAKVIVFSEWERMLELVRDSCEDRKIAVAWHTGSVPQKQRRTDIQRFKDDPQCRVFLTTDAGATGLNLQVASVVVNCDLPWNPARLEQRIARAWRKHQTRTVAVFNLITEDSIEQRMLETLATKRTVAESVLDLEGSVQSVPLRSGRKAMVERLKGLVSTSTISREPTGQPSAPPDLPATFSRAASERLGAGLIACEERVPMTGNGIVLVAVVDQVTPRIQGQLESLLGEFYPGVDAGAAAPRLELLDRATSEMIERLISAGLLQPTARFSRPLPLGNRLDKPPPLSEEECRRAAIWRERCRHVLRRGRVLGQAGFADEARESVIEALHAIGRALAIEKRLPDPESLSALREPAYKFLWGSEGDMVQGFLQNSEVSWEPVVVVLERLAS